MFTLAICNLHTCNFAGKGLASSHFHLWFTSVIIFRLCICQKLNCKLIIRKNKTFILTVIVKYVYYTKMISCDDRFLLELIEKYLNRNEIMRGVARCQN